MYASIHLYGSDHGGKSASCLHSYHMGFLIFCPGSSRPTVPESGRVKAPVLLSLRQLAKYFAATGLQQRYIV